ncbi:F-box only 31-B-like [Haematococcus lacustris]|uniref:F-box only 31-B-like n=1 Tax=Haematococcus lacustris TaxID=44745 RepID=A0A699Z9Q3_HAELA|nr:F-box only 31-B-like [Haematococcus lacustris]
MAFHTLSPKCTATSSLPLFSSKPYVTLNRLGLWTAEYGSHGPEVLNLQALGSGSPALEACPVKPPCLMGTKLVGDVNVPSGRLSFVANLQEFKLGRYDGRDVASQALDFRPILPGQWSPSWEVIEMGKRRGMLPTCSVYCGGTGACTTPTSWILCRSPCALTWAHGLLRRERTKGSSAGHVAPVKWRCKAKVCVPTVGQGGSRKAGSSLHAMM